MTTLATMVSCLFYIAAGGGERRAKQMLREIPRPGEIVHLNDGSSVEVTSVSPVPVGEQAAAGHHAVAFCEPVTA